MMLFFMVGLLPLEEFGALHNLTELKYVCRNSTKITQGQLYSSAQSEAAR
jgi:hypothetical protein